ncbi:serine hydrolase domain-containing protein [Bacillus kwashiorkori]|uniref:serine hydrolase domain-containing protein n=1 Tax=Bacillus kwashiorkori TaxID=1522318 RepID=UPI000784E9AA|nr:serine hydrolase domain-containing protein [Bacillus kwashiorkori]
MEKVVEYIKRQVEQKNLPGAAIHISYQGETLLHAAIGYRSLEPKIQPMTIDTVFDLASLTKVVATNPAVLKLIDEGELMLHDPVSRYLSEFAKNGKEEIKIRHLLTHTSGLTAHRPYYLDCQSREEVLAKIYEETPVEKIGEKVIYSDLGFILLSKVIEVISGMKFEKFVQNNIFQPLEMLETGFNLPFAKERFAVTEKSRFTNKFKAGTVHDDNAEAMGGVSGHAGLFATLADLEKFAAMIENDGVYFGKRILSKSVLQLAKNNFTYFDTNEYRGLGWQLKGPQYAPCGDLFSPKAFGHTGYTGTSIWFDPEINLHVIFLTNRVHIENKQEILSIRPKLHNLIRASLL